MSLTDVVHAILHPVRVLQGEHEESIGFRAAVDEISALHEASLSGGVILHRREGLEIVPSLVKKTSVSFTSTGVQVALYFRQVMIPVVSPSRTVTYKPAHTFGRSLSVVKVTGRNGVKYDVHGDVIDPSKHRFFGFQHEHHYHYGYDVQASFIGYVTQVLQENPTSA